jgi:hypothetical protein
MQLDPDSEPEIPNCDIDLLGAQPSLATALANRTFFKQFRYIALITSSTKILPVAAPIVPNHTHG